MLDGPRGFDVPPAPHSRTAQSPRVFGSAATSIIGAGMLS